MEVLNEVGEMWDDLTDIDRSAISTALGGTYQRNTLMAIFENWNEVKEAQEVAADSAGSTERKYADYMESIEAHLNQLKTTWSEFLVNLQVSGVANNFLDALNGLVKILDFLINKTPAATFAITALTAALVRLGAIKLNDLAKSMAKIVESSTKAGSSGKGGFFSGLFSFMSGKDKTASSTAKGLTTVGTAAQAAGTGAKAGAVGFAALGKAITSVVLPLAAISLALWAVPKILDAIIVTNDELAESMEEHIAQAEQYQTEIDEANQQRTENLQEQEILQAKINSGTATKEEKEKVEALQKQNTILEEQIKLKEQMRDLENQEATKDQQQMFKNEFNLEGQSALSSIWSFLSGEGSGENKVKNQVETYKSYLAQIDEANRKASDAKTEYERDGWLKEVEFLEGRATTAYEDLLKVYEEWNDVDLQDDELNKVKDSMMDIIETIPTLSNRATTLGEVMSGSMDNAEVSAESLSSTIKEIAGMEIVPRDAKDMEEWLNSLSSTDLTVLQRGLELAGASANVLGQVLSTMSQDDAMTYMTALVKNFTGEINNATEATDLFKKALETDYNEDFKNQLQMMDYIEQSRKSGVKNRQAYNAALQGVFGTTNEDLIDFNKLNAFDRFFNGQSFNIEAFVAELKEAGSAYAEVTGSIEDSDLNISIKDFSALAESVGMTETQLSSVLTMMSVSGDFAITGTVSALDKQFQSLSESIEKSDELLGKLHSLNLEGQIDNGIWSDENESKLRSYVDEFNSLFGDSLGVNIEIGADANVDELNAAYQDALTYTTKIKELFDPENNTWDFSSILQNLQEQNIEGLEIDIDEGSIQVNTQEAAQALQEQIKESLTSGINNQQLADSLLANLFDNVNITGVTEGATSAINTWINSVDTTLSTSGLAMGEAMNETNEQLGTTIELSEDVNGKVTDVTQSINNLNNQSLSSVQSQITGLSTAAIPAITTFSTLRGILSSINGTNVNVKVNTTKSGGDADGEVVPKYANGTGALGGKPLRRKNGGQAIVGEEGRELVIDKHGKQRIVGANGAELTHLNAGDTVIPHNVTEMALSGQIGTYAGGGQTSGIMTYGGTGTINVGKVESLYTTGSYIGGKGSSSGGGTKSSGGSSSSSSTETSDDPAEDLIAELKHRLNMQYITEKQYVDELTKIWQQYYKGKEEFRDKDWQLEEEIYKLRQQFVDEQIDTLEYQNGLLERTYGTEQDQVINLKRMQDYAHQQADALRARGFDDLSPEIREWSEKWWKWQDEIDDLNHQMFENMIDDSNHYVDILDEQLSRIPDFVKDGVMTTNEVFDKAKEYADSKIDIYEQKVIQYYNQLADIEAERQRLIREDYSKNKKMIQELESDAEKLKTNIVDAAEEIRQIKLDEIQEDLDAQEELRTAIREYAEEQIDLLQEKIDLLEKENEEKEKANELEQLQQNLENARNNRYKRVYHRDTG